MQSVFSLTSNIWWNRTILTRFLKGIRLKWANALQSKETTARNAVIHKVMMIWCNGIPYE